MNSKLLNHYLAIDPMALLLSGNALAIWHLIHHPNVPPARLRTELDELVKQMSPEDRNLASVRARAIGEIAQALEQAIGKTESREVRQPSAQQHSR